MDAGKLKPGQAAALAGHIDRAHAAFCAELEDDLDGHGFARAQLHIEAFQLQVFGFAFGGVLAPSDTSPLIIPSAELAELIASLQGS